MDLRERILAYRAKNGISQNKMDFILGVSSQTVFRIEGKKYKLREARKFLIEQKMDELEGAKNV